MRAPRSPRRAHSPMATEHRSPSFSSLVCLAGWTAQEEHLAPPSPEGLLLDCERRASLEAVHSVLHRGAAFERAPSAAQRDQRPPAGLYGSQQPEGAAPGAQVRQRGQAPLPPATPPPVLLAPAAQPSASCSPRPSIAQPGSMDDGLGSRIATSAVPGGISFNRGGCSGPLVSPPAPFDRRCVAGAALWLGQTWSNERTSVLLCHS